MFKVAIIGHTGRGNYGHFLDRSFQGVEETTVVALADPDDKGRASALERTGAKTGYADYRQMLDRENPDIVVVATREVGDHRDIVIDVAERGAHIYLEKPAAATPEEVVQMMTACDRNGSLLVLAHPWRGHPPIQQTAIPLIKSGKIGEPRLARAYGMNGYAKGGNQYFLDLYPHFFDFLWQIAGPPLWCQAHITKDGRSVTPADLFQGIEGMGLVAGNGIKAYYAFENGFAADFESYEGDSKDTPYRIDLFGTEGSLSLPGPVSNTPDIFYHPRASPPPFGDDRWEIIPSNPPPDDHKWVRAHHRMARSIVATLKGETPEFELVQGENTLLYTEMAMMAHAAHISGTRVTLPLPDGKNPFDHWKE